MGGQSNIYEFQIHSNSLTRFSKKLQKNARLALFSTLILVFFFVLKSRVLTV